MKFETISESLGGEQVLHKEIHSAIDLFMLAKTGIPKQTVEELAPMLGWSVTSLVENYLPISLRSFQRKQKNELLSLPASESILRIAEVYSRGLEVFDNDSEELKRWISTKNIPLGGVTPAELLVNSFGVSLVLERLEMIEYGMY